MAGHCRPVEGFVQVNSPLVKCQKGYMVSLVYGAAARSIRTFLCHDPPIPAPALAKGFAGAREVGTERGNPALGHGWRGGVNGRNHQRPFLSFD